MMTTIKCNMTFSMVLNFIAIALAISDVLNPVVGALVHNAGSVLVITNSAFLVKVEEIKTTYLQGAADFARVMARTESNMTD